MGLWRKRTQVIVLLVWSLGLLLSCGSEKASRGPSFGGNLGLVEGVILDSPKSWRGGMIGGVLGEAMVSRVTEISTRVSREAAREEKPMAYQSSDGTQRVEAHPFGKRSNSNCRLIREQIYQEGKLVRDELREVCQ